MLWPQYLIVAAMLSVAFLPQLYLNIIFNLLGSMGNALAIVGSSGFSGFSKSIANINLYSLLFLVIVVGVWGLRAYVIRGKSQKLQTT